MPSFQFGYVPGSGFQPLFSGNPYSGTVLPKGYLQLHASKNNSGAVYVALSGAYPVSGQVSLLVGSGGATINSGSIANPASGGMDGYELFPGDTIQIPRGAFLVRQGVTSGNLSAGPQSGTIGICVGCDPAVSGQGRLHYEFF